METQYTRIIKVKNVVEKILIEEPKTRDDDRLLILKVWKEEYPSLANASFRDFSIMYLSKKFTDTESIRRSRQKLQELNPSLRGKSQLLRSEQENEMREFISTISNE